MQIQVEFSLVPIGGDPHLARDIALCQQILLEHGLHVELHAMGTNIEGDWDTVMTAIRACHQALHRAGRPRLYGVLKIVSAGDGEKSFAEKVASVQRHLVTAAD